MNARADGSSLSVLGSKSLDDSGSKRRDCIAKQESSVCQSLELQTTGQICGTTHVML